MLGKYRRTLQPDRRHLLEQFTLAEVARKVVRVGSVGTRAWVVLIDADGAEPLFLQAKRSPTVRPGRLLRAATGALTKASASSRGST